MKNSMASSGRITANTYDSVGNILRVNSSYPMPQYQVTERYTYDSADQLLSAASTCNNNLLCSGAYSYNNWGKINTYTQQTTDPATNTSENKDYRYYFPGSSADMAQGQTSFAPIMKYDMQQNPQPLETCTYGINGSLRKRVDHQTQNTDYYYFNASGNLKACGTDMQISLYGYNSANTRTYKVNLLNANQWVNGQPQPIQPMVQNAMFYPNTYINFTQAGEYTKHYYNGAERICSRLGEQQIPISVENNQELEAYQHDVKQILYNAIGQHLYDNPVDFNYEGEHTLEFLQVTGDNNAIFYYHPNHLSSTMYVTDAQQSVVQSFLYAPYGDIISEYNTHVMGEAFPKYSFNAKELDEETGFYYYEARYYNPPTFISRDPLMSEKPWLTPYHYCSNNPIGRVDPSGMMDDWVEKNGTIYWDNSVTSPTETKGDVNYLGKEGYGYDEESGGIMHYKPDGTKSAYVITLKGISVSSNGEAYQTENRSISNNNKSGYYWNEKDLKVWELIKNSNSPIGRYVNAQVKRGNFEILSAENYWNTYGYTLGHLKMVQEFITMASLFSPGVNGVPTVKFGGYRGVITPTNAISKSKVPTFNEFRSANKGNFAGYKGRGTNTAEAWKSYKAKYGNKAVFK